jgi:predicted amidohydrolase YtcJ
MLRTLALALAAVALYVPLGMADDPAELILHNGRIVTVDREFSVVPAMAVRDGRVVAIGAEADVLKLQGAGTQVIDLEGGMVLPGLIDSHVHPSGASMYEFDHAVPAMESIDDVLAYIRDRAKVVPEGEWIVLQQVFITRLREQRYPTKQELDEAAPKHPVVFRTGPDASVNSLALAENGIDREFAAAHPDQVMRDPQTGEPTGILRKHGSILKTQSPSTERKPTQQDRDDRLALLIREYNKVGLTGIIDRNCSDSAQSSYERLLEDGRLTIRARLSRGLNPDRSLAQVTSDLEEIAADELFTKPDPRLAIIGVKVFLDGGMLTGSAYMNEPWGVSSIYGIDDPAYRGMRYIPEDRLAAIVKACVDRKLAFTAHSVGDGAVQGLLDAYETVNQEVPIEPTHSTITHSNFMSEDSVRRCAELGVGVDIQPAWLYLDTRTLAAQFGEERLRWFQPLRSLFEAGVPVGGGSDHMQKLDPLASVNPYHPFLGMWIAMTRQARWYDGRLHPEETLSREQAIRFYTINNAWLMRAEDEIGSLEKGKRADFILIDRDILTCPVDEVRETNVLETFVDGERVLRVES